MKVEFTIEKAQGSDWAEGEKDQIIKLVGSRVYEKTIEGKADGVPFQLWYLKIESYVSCQCQKEGDRDLSRKYGNGGEAEIYESISFMIDGNRIPIASSPFIYELLYTCEEKLISDVPFSVINAIYDTRLRKLVGFTDLRLCAEVT